MKKKFLLSTILIAALCLCGCNTQITFEQGNEQGSENGSANVSVTNPVDDTQNGNQGNGGAQQTSKYLDVSVDKMHDSDYDQVSLMYGNCCQIQLNTSEYSALKETVIQYNYETEQNWNTVMNDLKSWAREDYNSAVNEGYDFWGPYVSEDTMYITRADNKALSAVTENYWYSGGAHGMTGYSAVNFDTQTGKILAIEDVITNTSALPDALAVEIFEQYPHLETTTQDMWDMSMEDFFASYLTPLEENDMTPEFTWTLGYEGVTFYFGAYEIGSYADGNQVVVLTYNEYPELFNAEYFTSVTQDYAVRIMPVGYSEEGLTDLNGDGVMDMVTVDGNYDADYDMYTTINVTVNNNTYTQDAWYYEMTSYLVKANGHTYIYAESMSENDYRTIYVFKVTESSVEFIGEVQGSGIADFNNSADFGLTKRFDLLSTYYGQCRFYVGEDGMPVQKEDVYEIKLYEDTPIVSTVNINAELIDENGNLIGETYEFPVGTEYHFRRTDGMTYVDMMTSEGKACRLYTTSAGSTVNGMDAWESFEMLYYAG